MSKLTGLTPLKNEIPILRPFKNRYFCSLERLVFYVEHYQTLFLDLFCPKREQFFFSNSWLKSWVKPFGEFQFRDRKGMLSVCITYKLISAVY